MVTKLRKRRVALVMVILFALLIGICGQLFNEASQHAGAAVTNVLYAPQPGRSAEWDGPNGKTSSYSSDTLQKIARYNSYEIIPKFADNFNIQAHFQDAHNIATLAAAYGNPIKIFDYYNASVWFDVNFTGWKPYSDSFDKSWYLKDAQGNTIPYYGVGSTVSDGSAPIGYQLDLTNPAYRIWAAQTLVAWIKAQPAYSGFAFDSANALLGNTSRSTFGDGASTWNDLLCGSGASQDAQGDCSRVASWNAGLASLLSEVKTALQPYGGEVLYNGVAPSQARGASRNIGLLNSADIASNESFCYGAAAVNKDTLKFNPLADDISMMQQVAASGKKIFEITNYQVSDKLQYSSYCLGGFLMGWQPGSSYWIYHQNYYDPLTGAYPQFAEQNLNLGNPSATYTASGALFTRSFQNGFVAVNSGDGAVTVTLPAKLVQFSDGKQGVTYNSGSQLPMGARSSMFFLNADYVDPGSAPAPANTGSPNGAGNTNNSGSTGSSSGPNTTVIPKSSVTTKSNSNGLNIDVDSVKGLVRVEYYIDGHLTQTITRFPVHDGTLDTTGFKNGSHTLVTKYYYQDGSVSTTSQAITVHNMSFGGQIFGYIRRALLPASLVMLLLVIVFIVFHRLRMIVPRWFYHHHPELGVVTRAGGVSASYNPGGVVHPNHDDQYPRN